MKTSAIVQASVKLEIICKPNKNLISVEKSPLQSLHISGSIVSVTSWKRV